MSDPGSNSNKLPALDQSPGVIRRQLSSSAAERKQRLQQQLQDESDSENSDDEMSFSSIDVRQYQAGGYNTLPNQEKVMPKPEAPSKGKRRRKKHHDLEIIEGLRDGVKFVDKPDIYQGYMLKKRRWPMKGWHKRYFNLDKGFLYYSKSPQDLQKCKFHGKIDVGMSVVAFKRYSHRIYIDAEDIVYHLKIKDDRLFSEWLKRIKNHRLYRQHELAYGNKDSPRLTEITSPTEELPDLKKSLNLKDRRDKPEMIRKASFNRESSQTRVANWLADTAGFESWNRELSHVRSMLVGLKEDMEEIRELPFLTDSSLTDSHEVEFTEKKKPRAWLGRRKERKHTDQHSLNSADISESSSVPTTPSEKNLRSSCSNPNLINYERNSRPRSVPEYSTPDNHEQRIKELKLREQFIGKAEEIYSCMSSLLRTMGTERDRLKLAVDDSNDIPIINPTLPGHASSVISLRTSLADAYRQIAELKTKLSRIHDESSMNIEPSRQLSSPLTTPLDFHEPRLSQSLSTESCAMSEYYDAEDFNKDSNSESSSEQSDDEEINSDNSDDNNTEFSQHLSQSVSEEILMDKCQTGRRSKLPVPKPEGGDISMWNLLYRNIGKDLTKISMPVTLNEPLSMLQRLCEEMEYSELIDKALEMKDPYERMLYIAAFAVSSYASSGHRAGHKPFNPILGETYECVREDKGWKFIAEQVSHHPPISACHCDAKHYTFHQDVRIKTKFWGKSMEIQPTGVVKLHLPKFNDYYEWNKVTTCVHNLLGGKRWVDQYGEMQIRNGDIVCKLTFTKANNMSGKRHDIFGRIFNQDGKVVHNIFGKWNEALYCGHAPSAKCVWRPGAMPDDFELYYGFTRFAIELNELDPDQCKYLPPTDSRFRPDQRHLEEGRITESENEKHRVEQLQRERRKKMEAQRVHHESKWFRKTQQNGKELYEYNGLYWEKRKDPGFANMTFPKLW